MTHANPMPFQSAAAAPPARLGLVSPAARVVRAVLPVVVAIVAMAAMVAMAALPAPLLAAAQAAQPAPPPAAAAPAPPATSAGAPAAPPGAAPGYASQPFGSGTPPPTVKLNPAGPQPPDGKWLKDNQGRLYFIDKMRKVQGQYGRIDDHTVRTVWGVPIDVVREDDHYFYYKVYKTDPNVKSVNANQPPTAEQLEKVAASYKVDTPESHRLRFTDFGKGLPKSGQWREGFVLADMNGDGHLDIVHGPPRKGLSPPVIFLGDGKGSWRRWTEAHFAPFAYDYGDIAVADLNGDGHLDLVLAMHLKGFTALLGDGKGNFLTRWDKGLDYVEPGKGADESSVYTSKAIAMVNWNHDKRPDILALGEGPRLNIATARGGGGGGLAATTSYGPVLYLNQGDGSWKRKDQGTGHEQVFGDSIAVGDFNGDGLPDFAVSSGIMSRRDLVNLARPDGGWDKVEIDVRPMSYVRAVAAGDFDHDGRSDLAVGYISFEGAMWRTGIDIFYSRPGNKWERRTLAVKEGREGVSALAVGDLDGDGNLDLVALTGDGNTWVFLGDGKGFFTREAATIPAYGPGCSGSRVRLADLDGDGKDEIVSSWAGEYSPMYAPEACRTEGGITAWHAVPVAAAAATAPAVPPVAARPGAPR
jgi:hypothetical protein